MTWPEADFLSLVNDMGGPPDQEKTRFWQEVLYRWRTEPASEFLQLNSWRAVRQKYVRLEGRKNIRELMTPNPEVPETRAEERRWALEQAAKYSPPKV